MNSYSDMFRKPDVIMEKKYKIPRIDKMTSIQARWKKLPKKTAMVGMVFRPTSGNKKYILIADQTIHNLLGVMSFYQNPGLEKKIPNEVLDRNKPFVFEIDDNNGIAARSISDSGYDPYMSAIKTLIGKDITFEDELKRFKKTKEHQDEVCNTEESPKIDTEDLWISNDGLFVKNVTEVHRGDTKYVIFTNGNKEELMTESKFHDKYSEYESTWFKNIPSNKKILVKIIDSEGFRDFRLLNGEKIMKQKDLGNIILPLSENEVTKFIYKGQ